MHSYVEVLQHVATRYAPSRVLSYDMVHVFKTLQLINDNGHVSRENLCYELELGEGTVKTLVRHLKMQGLVESSNAGTKMTKEGKSFFSELLCYLPFEMPVSKCKITLGKHNYAILIKEMKSSIKSGIEQRDAAIKVGASGATTLLYENKKFLIPQTNYDALKDEQYLAKRLIENLHPAETDVIIIGTDNHSKKRAEFAAKNAALVTVLNHRAH
jgi:uncharacterized protein DUF4443/CggR-like protein